MNYELKIKNAAEANGTIDLQRLAAIADSMKNISEGALQIRLKGISITKGRKKVSLKDALKISLSGIKKGSTILKLETDKFEKTLSFQTDVFLSEIQQDLPQQTPVSLFILAFQMAVNDEAEDNELLDKPLLKELKQFKRAFLNDDEIFVIKNEGNLPPLELKKADFRKIKHLEEELPDPEPVILNGIVEELKYSKLKVKIQTKEGIVDGFLTDTLSPEDIAPWWGKEVTITGTSHFKPGGRSVIEIERIFESGKGDAYFSKKPKSETAEQQLERQIREKGSNRLTEIVGKWPGEETDEEFEEMLSNL